MIFRNRLLAAAPGADPRHVEAVLRFNQPAGWIDGLTTEDLTAEIRLAAVLSASVGPYVCERLAATFGMHLDLRSSFAVSQSLDPSAAELALADTLCAEANRLDAAHYHLTEAAEGCL